MFKWQFREMLKHAERELSPDAYYALECIFDTLTEETDEISEDEITEELYSYIDFTCYSDAWDYLRDNQITDFSDAIQEFGATDVCSIACYYCEQEINAYIYENFDWFEDISNYEPEDYNPKEDE